MIVKYLLLNVKNVLFEVSCTHKLVFTKCSFDRTQPTIQNRTSELFRTSAIQTNYFNKIHTGHELLVKIKAQKLILKLEPYWPKYLFFCKPKVKRGINSFWLNLHQTCILKRITYKLYVHEIYGLKCVENRPQI